MSNISQHPSCCSTICQDKYKKKANYFQFVSEKNSANPVIRLVPGAGRNTRLKTLTGELNTLH